VCCVFDAVTRKKVLACEVLKYWQLGSVDVFVQDSIKKQQLADGVVEEFHLDSGSVEVGPSKDDAAAAKFEKCTSYGISVFDPSSAVVIETLTRYKTNKDSAWSNKWGSNKCASSGTTIRISIFFVFISIFAAISNEFITI